MYKKWINKITWELISAKTPDRAGKTQTINGKWEKVSNGQVKWNKNTFKGLLAISGYILKIKTNN